MSRQQDILLRKLCAQIETLTKAQVFLHSASVKTGPGTGYDLGQGALGLPAICAYLASQDLANGDVSEKVAQTASCLAPKIFKTTVNTVRAAIATSSSQAEEEDSYLTYIGLIAENRLGRKAFVLGCMKDVEKSLLASRTLPQEFQPPCDILTVAIFCWACNNLLKVKKVHADALLTKYELSKRDYDDIIDILEASCQDAAEKVRQKVAHLSTKVIAASKTSNSSPSKKMPNDSISKSPTKSSLKLRSSNDAVDFDNSPTKTPTHKRKVAFAAATVEADDDVLETPSKRQRITSPKKPAAPAGEEQPTRTPLRTPKTRLTVFPNAKASSSRSTLDILQHPEAETAGPLLEEESGVDELPPTSGVTMSVPAPVAGPSTPRRRGPKPPLTDSTLQTPQRSGNRGRPRVSQPPTLLDDREPDYPRRFRPVFLDHFQWLQRDPKVVREWKMADTLRKDAMAKHRDDQMILSQ